MEVALLMTSKEFDSRIACLRSFFFRFAMHLTKNKEDSEDLMQETMMRAYTNRNKYTDGTNFKAWMATIMRNCFINEYRKKRNRNKVEQSVNWNIMTVAVNQPVSNLAPTILMMKEILHKLDGLNEGHRIPFELFFSGFKYVEIAEQLDLPIGTVKSRIFLARKKLKDMIFEYYGENIRRA